LGGENLAHRYLWNPQVVDQLFADEQIHWDAQAEEFITDELLWALTDHQHTVRNLAAYDAQNNETAIVLHRVFDAFGNETDSIGATDCRCHFATVQWIDYTIDSTIHSYLGRRHEGQRLDAGAY